MLIFARSHGPEPETSHRLWGLNSDWLLCIILFVSVVSLRSQVSAETVDRLNLGVMFKKISTMSTVYDHWPHTFQINFPQLDMNVSTINNVRCNVSSSSMYACKALRSAVHTLNSINNHHLSQQNHLLQMTRQIVQANPVTQVPRSRSKRAILPFIGSLSHTLFGTATSKEVERLKSHIMSLEDREVTMASTFEKYSDDLSSFMTITNDRLSSFTDNIEDNHNAILKMTGLFSNIAHTVEDNLKFSVHLIKDIYLAMALQENLLEFVHGIESLINLELSPFLIPISNMKTIIDHINSQLRNSHSDLYIKDMSAHEIYSDPKFHWTFTNSSIFITHYFPLTSAISHLTVYNVRTIPVPLDGNSSHVTVLTEMPPFIAFSNDQHYHTYFDKFPGSIHSNYIDASIISVPLFPMAQASCLTALFFEHRQAVKDLCLYKVKTDSISPSIQYVENSRYLIANTTEIFLNCPTGRKRQVGCQFWIMTIPCQCDVTTANTYFPPRLNDCYENEISVLHPVNLAVLMHLKELSQLNHIPANAAYTEVPNSLMLNVKLFSHNFTKFVAADSDKILSLSKVVDSVKDGKYVFRSLAEPILDQLLDNDKDFDYFSWNAIVMYADLGVLIIVCIFIVYILRCVNRLNGYHVALYNVGKVRSLQLFSTTTTTTSPTPHVVTEVDNSFLYVILVLRIFTLLFIGYKYIIRKVRHASIALEITDGHRCVIIPLVSIPFCPKFYHVQTEENFSNFKVI